jgi:hypothetical protein
MHRAIGLICLLAVAGYAAPLARAEEFVGPFASWADLKRDYHAVGDGRADDTAVLQKALDDLGSAGHSRVLYIPAGTYRITQGLKMASHIYVSVLGEDPARTAIRWDGPSGGVMLNCNGVRYSRFGRLTWNGAGRAQTAVMHAWDGKTPGANTHNEHADEVFMDVGYGIRGGSLNYMDAECPILRCRFLRCTQAGVSIENFNALDWWIWNCKFEDCRVGVTNDPGAGHFHVYQSMFLRSTEADMKMANTSYFSIRRNISIGSQMFFKAGWIGAGAEITMQGNYILDPKSAPAIQIGNLGPLLLLDNVLRSDKRPAVLLNDNAPYLTMSNTFTIADPIQGGRKIAGISDSVLPGSKVEVVTPEIPGALPNRKRFVTELPSGCMAAAIQQAIDAAARMRGKRPIVHLPAGSYAVDRTLVIPAGCDAQLVGDGYETTLRWTGAGDGPVLRLDGPSRATLRDLTVNGAGAADAIVVENCDQPGARIFMEQGEVTFARQVGLLADRVIRADVSLHDFYHSDCKGVAVKAVGIGRQAMERPAGGRICIFGGASSNNELSYEVAQGGRLMAQDIWYEGQPPRFMRCTDSGTFTLNGAEVACADPNHGGKEEGIPAVEVDGFKGSLTFMAAIFSTRIRVRGDGRETNVLALGIQGNGDDYFRSDSPNAPTARLGCLKYTPGGGAVSIPDQGAAAPAFLRRMLAQMRLEKPRPLTDLKPGITDVRFYRVNAENGLICIHLKGGP